MEINIIFYKFLKKPFLYMYAKHIYKKYKCLINVS